MLSSEVQRTLVKSPPELWAELSDPASLARHLGELGEIRITRVEPEQAVEWEAGDTSGTVHIVPSGWGTKVTLTVTRDTNDSEPLHSEPVHSEPVEAVPVEAVPESEADPWQVWVGADPASEIAPTTPAALGLTMQAPLEPDEPDEPLEPDEPDQADEPEALVDPEPEPTRRGFFARLFRRRPRPEPVAHTPYEDLDAYEDLDPYQDVDPHEDPDAYEDIEPHEDIEHHGDLESREDVERHEDLESREEIDGYEEIETAGAPDELVEDERVAEVHPHEASPERADADTAEGAAAPETADDADPDSERVEAVLTAVLDRLGAAHHRPFSRQ